MKHLGDITKISGYAVLGVSVVIGGSPCQDLSVAGKRAGFDGERSVLFLDQIRVIKEMREQVEGMAEQVSKFDPDSWYGKTCPEHSAAEKEKTSGQCSKKRQGSKIRMPLFLDLRTGNGEMQALSWETDGASLGGYLMHSFGESPSVAVESHLSQILEDTPHRKYYLSAAACQGIMRRAERRGKELPEMLKTALERQSME